MAASLSFRERIALGAYAAREPTTDDGFGGEAAFGGDSNVACAYDVARAYDGGGKGSGVWGESGGGVGSRGAPPCGEGDIEGR